MTPYLDKAQEIAAREFGLIAGRFAESRALFGQDWAAGFDAVLRKMMPDEEALRAALAGYTEFVVDSMRMQVAFQKTGRYQTETFEDACRAVYHDEAHMTREYLPALLLSHFLWPHHWRHAQFFRHVFLPELAAAEDARFHDVGVGTGFYTVSTLEGAPAANCIGWDVSPHSVAFAEKLAQRAGVGERVTFRLEDIRAQHDAEPRPFLVCIEVLEHVPDPMALLHTLGAMLTDGGKAFLGTALNAAHRDHIYLYRNEQDVIDHVEAAGFTVETVFSARAYSPTRRMPLVPSATAVVARK